MAEKHYFEQIDHTQNYLIPYFEKHIPDFRRLQILEVGCAEGGFLKVLQDLGMKVTGIEIAPHRVKIAKQKNPELDIRVMDVTDPEIVEELGSYDMVVLRDVIEHVPDRNAAFLVINKLLENKGYLYITFPPKYSGFAGHQQNCRSIMKHIPYIHILPGFLIRMLGRLLNEKQNSIEGIIRNFKDGLTIHTFEKLYTKHRFHSIVKELFIFRPVFKIRFNLNPQKIPNIPLLREFTAFGCEYLLQKFEEK